MSKEGNYGKRKNQENIENDMCQGGKVGWKLPHLTNSFDEDQSGRENEIEKRKRKLRRKREKEKKERVKRIVNEREEEKRWVERETLPYL